jgi:hypothetical protein
MKSVAPASTGKKASPVKRASKPIQPDTNKRVTMKRPAKEQAAAKINRRPRKKTDTDTVYNRKEMIDTVYNITNPRSLIEDLFGFDIIKFLRDNKDTNSKGVISAKRDIVDVALDPKTIYGYVKRTYRNTKEPPTVQVDDYTINCETF